MISKKARKWLEMPAITPAQHDHAGLHVVTYITQKYLLATDTYRIHMVRLKDCELPDGKYDNDFERIGEVPTDYTRSLPGVSDQSIELSPDLFQVASVCRKNGDTAEVVEHYIPGGKVYMVDSEFYQKAIGARWKILAMTVNGAGCPLRIDFLNGNIAAIMPLNPNEFR